MPSRRTLLPQVGSDFVRNVPTSSHELAHCSTHRASIKCSIVLYRIAIESDDDGDDKAYLDTCRSPCAVIGQEALLPRGWSLQNRLTPNLMEQVIIILAAGFVLSIVHCPSFPWVMCMYDIRELVRAELFVVLWKHLDDINSLWEKYT